MPPDDEIDIAEIEYLMLRRYSRGSGLHRSLPRVEGLGPILWRWIKGIASRNTPMHRAQPGGAWHRHE